MLCYPNQISSQPCEKLVKKGRFGAGQEAGYRLMAMPCKFVNTKCAIATTVTSTGRVPGLCVPFPTITFCPVSGDLCTGFFENYFWRMQGFWSCNACPAAAELWVSAVEFNLVAVAELLIAVNQPSYCYKQEQGCGERQYILLGQKTSLGKTYF